mmetsp:Transcript_4233/g.10846  ORF Transcript_4233/g.10846 Transcript_4233/m.10846 type:complete len:111 (-) Transcript_4233:20-352(-)
MVRVTFVWRLCGRIVMYIARDEFNVLCPGGHRTTGVSDGFRMVSRTKKSCSHLSRLTSTIKAMTRSGVIKGRFLAGFVSSAIVSRAALSNVTSRISMSRWSPFATIVGII